jgi:hypothetical protein
MHSTSTSTTAGGRVCLPNKSGCPTSRSWRSGRPRPPTVETKPPTHFAPSFWRGQAEGGCPTAGGRPRIDLETSFFSTKNPLIPRCFLLFSPLQRAIPLHIHRPNRLSFHLNEQRSGCNSTLKWSCRLAQVPYGWQLFCSRVPAVDHDLSASVVL